MVKPPFHFFEIEVEVFPGYPTVVIEPVFRIRPEALNTIEMISAFRFTLFLSDYHMVTADIEKGVCVPIIGLLQAACRGMVCHKKNSVPISPARYGECQHPSAPPVDTTYHMLTGLLMPPEPLLKVFPFSATMTFASRSHARIAAINPAMPPPTQRTCISITSPLAISFHAI